MFLKKIFKPFWIFSLIFVSILFIIIGTLISVNYVENISVEYCEKIASVLNQIDIANLQCTVQELESFQERHTREKQEQTARYLCNKVKSYGLDPKYHFYKNIKGNKTTGEEYINVVVELKGTTDPGAYFILGAHYDSEIGDGQIIAPGANDNGSGVAVILEAVRILKDLKLGHSLLIVFFSNEEQGHLGSIAFVEQYIKGNNLNIKGAIIVDMVGFERDSGDIDIATRPKYRWIADHMEKTIQLYTDYKVKKIIDRHCA